MFCGSDYPRRLYIIKKCHETFIKEVFLVKVSEAGVRPHIFDPRNTKQNQGNLSVFEVHQNYIGTDSSTRTALDGCIVTRVLGKTTLAFLVYCLLHFG